MGLKIAIMGHRGIPASYGGFETFAEQLGQRLVMRGHDITIYCRPHHIKWRPKYYKGMRLVWLRTIANKYLDTILHTFISSLHSLGQNYDVILFVISGNSPVTWIPRLVGTKTILNVDGLDWKRQKWPYAAKLYIKFAEYLATKLPTCYVTDSRVVQNFYRDNFSSTPQYIAYGSDVEVLPAGETLSRFQLTPNKYILFVGRLVAENFVHHLIEAYKKIDTDFKCVIVGDAPYAEVYKSYLKSIAREDSRIIFTGYVFGKGYQELSSHTYIFVETSGVGGTHPALIEAMAFGSCVVVHNTEENVETIAEAGFCYDGTIGSDSLRELLEYLLTNAEVVEEYRQRARKRAKIEYSWESVTNDYERLFYKLSRT